MGKISRARAKQKAGYAQSNKGKSNKQRRAEYKTRSIKSLRAKGR